MDLQQLRYVRAIAETGSFTRAAESCFVSQPSLSQQILKLESELGHKLFHRLGRRAVPTEAGQAFLERTSRALFEIDEATRAVRDDPNIGREITIGAIPTVAPYLVPQLLDRCRTAYPNLRINVHEDFRVRLIEGVLSGDLDLAISSLPVNDRQIAIEPLFSEPLMLVVHPNHVLAEKEKVSAHDLANETFVLLGTSSSLTMQIQRFCGDHDFEPRIGYRCTQISTVKALVSASMGISILPQVTRSHLDKKNLVYRKLDHREPVREIALIRHMQRYQSRGTEQFIRVLKEAVGIG